MKVNEIAKKLSKAKFLVAILFIGLLAGCGCISQGESSIDFDSNGGTNVEAITQDSGTDVLEPSSPTREGYTFDGWHSDKELNTVYTFTVMPSENITLYAAWDIINYDISYSLDGGVEGSNPSTYTIETTTITLEEPTKEGYTFLGWYDNAAFTGTPITEIPLGTIGNITIHAKWEIITYDITYSLDGGIDGNNPSTYTIETTTITLEEPTKEGYTFTGWYDNAAFTGTSITEIPLGTIGDIALHAKWQNSIIFDSNGGTNVETITQDSGTDVLEPSSPSREGYTFDGWYSDIELTTAYTFTVMPSQNITLYAKWTINQYTITYRTYDDYDHLISIPLNPGETLIQISLGIKHSSVLTSEGRLFTWGENFYGQLGDGTTIDRHTPIEITQNFNLAEGETLTHVSLGDSHSSALTSEGRLFTWGYNWDGQLGDRTTTERHTPTEITSNFSLAEDETLTQVSLGDFHSSALTSEGRLFTWGYNAYGELGDGTTIERHTPTEITSNFNLDEGETLTQISLGGYHSSALTSEGRLFTWGDNFIGQLGDGTHTNRHTPTEITSNFILTEGETLTHVSLGDSHSSALTSEGRLFTWGYNWYGQLGNGINEEYRLNPTGITSNFNLAEGETLTQISLGGYQSSALTSEGRLFTWGSNEDGQLGDGTTTDRYTPQLSVFRASYLIEISTFDFNESLVEYTPTKEGYTFDGWYSDLSLTIEYVFTTMPAEDIILYGYWIENAS